jgi:hypothetical protein
VIARLAAAAASLRDGDDAATTIAALDRDLEPLLSSERLRWTQVGVSACVSR